MTAHASSAFREVTAERADEFVARGHRLRHFFAHRVYHLPKCGPDALQIAEGLCGTTDPAAMWELVLYADGEALAGLPEDLFFDDEVAWHQQQFGRPGQVACANLVVDEETVHVPSLVSDLVQRISRRREHKTLVEKRFKGWAHMLLNAAVGLAAERGARRVRVASAALAGRHTDRSRQTDPTLFERVYDRTVQAMFAARPVDGWWEVDVEAARDRLVAPERRTEPLAARKVVCVLHDVERGLGHADVEPAFAREAERSAPRDLEKMREVEADRGVHATYCVVGALLDEVRAPLEADGHSLAFHSFDHRLDREDQLQRCREVDYRLKGYRPARSRISPELSDRNLLLHNFEWIASSPRSLGAAAPVLRDALVRLPIAWDDFPMHDAGLPYPEWERIALDRVAGSDFTAIGLHDCYARHWLPHYRGFLDRVAEVAELRTLDDVAAEVTLRSAA